MDDHTINAAVIVVEFPQKDIKTPIDYIMTLYGLDRDKIESSAISIEVDCITIKVIHPILLMQSKLHNLSIGTKRNEEGFEQARLSIRIVRAFLESLIGIQETDARGFLNLVRQVNNFALTDAGIAAFKRDRIDCMQAIPLEAIKRWDDPKIQKYIEKGFKSDERQVERFRHRGG